MQVKIVKYLLLLGCFIFIAFLDLFVEPRISLVALYSIPLIIAGVNFPTPVIIIGAILSWALGLIGDYNYVSLSELRIRYLEIAILFVIISYLGISFRLNKLKIIRQKDSLKQKYDEIETLVKNILEGFSAAIEAKDINLKGHSLNVAKVARSIAVKMNLGFEEERRVYFAGLLHDIGKIGINEQILNKPGKLTEEEFEIIRQHPLIGNNIIGQIEQFKDFGLYVLCHHERWDGQGYPRGLKNYEIPLGARIINIADSLDAMYSNRSYRNAMSINQIAVELKNCKGKQFDPQLVDIVLDNLHELLELISTYKLDTCFLKSVI